MSKPINRTTKTLNEIVGYIESFADRHQQLNDFGYGEIDQIERSKSLVYPAMWLNLQNSNLVNNGRNGFQELQMTFNVIVMDEVDNDASMIRDVQSDSQTILNDLVAELSYNRFYQDQDITLSEDIVIDPFVEQFSSYVSGARAELTLNVSFTNCYATDPLDSIPNYTAQTFSLKAQTISTTICDIVEKCGLNFAKDIVFEKDIDVKGVIKSGGTDLNTIINNASSQAVTGSDGEIQFSSGGTHASYSGFLFTGITLNTPGLSISNTPSDASSGDNILLRDSSTNDVRKLTLNNDGLNISNGELKLNDEIDKDRRFTGNVVVEGSVDILGTATTLNTQTVQTKDNQIDLNLSGTHATAKFGGINVVSGRTSGAPSKWVIDGEGNWSANTAVYSPKFVSGGTNLTKVIKNISSNNPAGSDTEVQINSGGTFGASSNVKVKNDDQTASWGGTETLTIGRRTGTVGVGSVVLQASNSYPNEASGEHSVAIGNNNVANAQTAYVEGASNTASGNQSHAEGNNTTSSGNQSHAEGQDTIASGQYSHAEGWNTTASGGRSHAEGYKTTSSGNASHAEGYNTTASASISHTEGWKTEASGLRSHAEGRDTTASNNESHAEGYNTTASGKQSHAEGYNTEASGNWSHTEGYQTTASENNSHAEGQETIASGRRSHAEGLYTATSGKNSHAEGRYTTASGNHSHSGGLGVSSQNVEASGEVSFNHSENDGNKTGIGARGNRSGILVGLNNDVQPSSTSGAIIGGENNSVSNNNSIVIGGNGSEASGPNSAVIGGESGNKATGQRAVVVGGYSNEASGDQSVAEGIRSAAYGEESHAEGKSSTSGTRAHSEGWDTSAGGAASHAEGRDTTASGNRGHAEGWNTEAQARNTHAEGAATLASVSESHAEGQSTESAARWSHAQGWKTKTSGQAAHSAGYGVSSQKVEASGFASFNHSENDGNKTGIGAQADRSAILGGLNNNIGSTATGSIVLGGTAISAHQPDTVYVPNLNIDTVPATATTNNAEVLGRDRSSGDVKQMNSVSTSTISTVDASNTTIRNVDFRTPVTGVTAAGHTATSQDHTLIVDATGGDVSLTLPDPQAEPDIEFYVKKTNSSNNINISTVNSRNIDGSTTQTITNQYDSIIVQSDGTQYWIF